MMKTSIKDIYWLAGILDGEGCFSLDHGKFPIISLAMTDEDIVVRVRNMINPKVHISSRVPLSYKRMYIVRFFNYYSIGWMMTLYPLLSLRRKKQIRDILSVWRNRKTTKNQSGLTLATGRILVNTIAKKHGISQYEATRRLHDGEFTTDSTGQTYIGGPLKTPKVVVESKPIVNPFEKRD